MSGWKDALKDRIPEYIRNVLVRNKKLTQYVDMTYNRYIKPIDDLHLSESTANKRKEKVVEQILKMDFENTLYYGDMNPEEHETWHNIAKWVEVEYKLYGYLNPQR